MGIGNVMDAYNASTGHLLWSRTVTPGASFNETTVANGVVYSDTDRDRTNAAEVRPAIFRLSRSDRETDAAAETGSVSVSLSNEILAGQNVGDPVDQRSSDASAPVVGCYGNRAQDNVTFLTVVLESGDGDDSAIFLPADERPVPGSVVLQRRLNRSLRTMSVSDQWLEEILVLASAEIDQRHARKSTLTLGDERARVPADLTGNASGRRLPPREGFLAQAGIRT